MLSLDFLIHEITFFLHKIDEEDHIWENNEFGVDVFETRGYLK